MVTDLMALPPRGLRRPEGQVLFLELFKAFRGAKGKQEGGGKLREDSTTVTRPAKADALGVPSTPATFPRSLGHSWFADSSSRWTSD